MAVSFDVAEYERLGADAQAVVGHAFRYAMALGIAYETGQCTFSRYEDGRQRTAWRRALLGFKGPQRLTASRMIADAMEAVQALRANPPRGVQ